MLLPVPPVAVPAPLVLPVPAPVVLSVPLVPEVVPPEVVPAPLILPVPVVLPGDVVVSVPVLPAVPVPVPGAVVVVPPELLLWAEADRANGRVSRLREKVPARMTLERLDGFIQLSLLANLN